MNFRVGQKVVCINAKNNPGCRWVGDAPAEGATYTVSGVGTSPISGRPVVFLEEVVRAAASAFYGAECGYWVGRFRPAVERKTDISVFTAMLTPQKSKEMV